MKKTPNCRPAKADIIRLVECSVNAPLLLPTCIIADYLTCLGKAITLALTHGQRVEIPDVGIIEVVKRAPTRKRNPRTGEMLEVPAKLRPRFRPCRALRRAVERGVQNAVCKTQSAGGGIV